MRPPPEMGVRWAKQARHTSQMDRLRMRGEELAVWQRLQGLQDATRRDGLTTTTAVAVAAGTDSSRISGSVQKCPQHGVALDSRYRAHTDTRLRCKVIAYMKIRVSFALINSLR